MTNIKGRTTEAWKNEPREGHANYDQWVTSLWYDNDEYLYERRQDTFAKAKMYEDPTEYLRYNLTRYIHRAARYAAQQEHTGVYLVKADVESLLADLLVEYQEYCEYHK